MSLLKQLEQAFGPGKSAGLDEYQFDCPFCIKRKGSADDHHHLYVNPSKLLHGVKGWYYCHRCQARGPLNRLLKGYGEIVARPPLSKWDEWLRELKNPTKTPSRQRAKVEMPEDYVPCFKGTEAYEYLLKRGITEQIVADYKIGFGCKDLKGLTREERRQFAGSGRIIFPDFDSEGVVVYWVARTYKDHKIKYKNPPDSDARDKVFNLVRASEYVDVVITEGVISAIAAGRNAVATYGKDVTRSQVAMMVEMGFSKYYVALDGDALKRDKKSKVKPPAIKLADDLHNRGCSVWMVLLPYEHDPASVGDFERRLAIAERYTLALEVELLMESKH